MNKDNQNKTRKRIITSTGIPMDEIGKLPPQSIEMEEAVLGAMLLEREAVETVLPILKKESFYKEQNGHVFDAIQRLWKRNEAVDILTVTQELKAMGQLEMVGGSYAVSGLTNRIASSANIEFHARIVEQKFMARELIRIGTNTIKEAYEDHTDVFELIHTTDKSLGALVNNISGNQVEAIGPIKDKVIEECQKTFETGHRSGIACSIESLNNQTNGWQKGDLIIIAGRPGMGKTAAAIDFALLPTTQGNKVAFFSLEMSKAQITSRIMAHITNMGVQKIVNKKFESGDVEYLKANTTSLDKAGLFIDDTPGITMSGLRNKARKLKQTKGIDLIIIDYLQLMEGEGKNHGNREQEISTISRGLKTLAKELDVPIIALSQLSRDVEKRPNKKPQLSDLRESGAIEQDADMVIFCFRPEYYGFDDYDMGKYVEKAAGLFMFIISKFRNGGPGEVKARWVSELAMVTNFNAII